MKRNIFRLGNAFNNEPISSIQNSEMINDVQRVNNSSRHPESKKRRDSSNPSTTIECLADQRIKELDSSSFLISTGRDKNEGSFREEIQNPKYDTSLHKDETLDQLNQDIENGDIEIEEIMHEQMIKIQG
jgi:hypothetical protein